MRSMRFSTLIVSSVVLLFPLYKLVQACGGYIDPYDYYPQFFPPSVTRQPAFTPFHYTSQLKYYDEWYELVPGDTIPDANLAAWAEYMEKPVSSADLDSFVYAYPYAELSSLYYHIEKGKPLKMRRSVERNAVTAWFKASKDLEALGYLMFAKQCEPHVSDAGGWEAPVRDTTKMRRLMRNGLQLHAAAKADFIKERYAFQALRLALYSEGYPETLELYSRLIGDDRKTGSEIFVRCLGLKAGALFRLGRKTEAAYLYSRAFDLSDVAKRSNYLSFDWATTADVAPVLALCQSPHERAVVQLMDGLNNYEQALPQIKAAYAADPELKGLDVLFTREINKTEERYLQEELLAQRNLRPAGWQGRYEGEYSKAEQGQGKQWKDYAYSLSAFAQQRAIESPAGRKAFWRLAAAYLSYIQNDAKGTERYLAMAAAQELSPGEKDVHDVISALSIVRRQGGMTAKAEAELLPFMRSLDARAAKAERYSKIYRDLLSTVITTGYLQRKDSVKAVIALGRVHRQETGFSVYDDFTDLPGSLLEQMSLDKLREVQRFVGSSGKSAWDAWLTGGTPYSADVLTELEGTRYLRQHQFARAAEVLRNVSPGLQEKHLLPDAFLPRVNDRMERDALDSGRMYTKQAFARKMDSLSRRDDAAGLFEFGCGLYGMSYYGKAHHAYDYYRSSTDGAAYYASGEQSTLPGGLQDYYGVFRAEKAFIQAAQKTNDADFRARSLWMAGKCWQKRCPPSNEENAYYLNSLRSPYFVQLAALASTPFMQKAYSTCSYYRDYAKKLR